MPELADVEGFRRRFARAAVGRRIRAVHTQDAAILRNTTPQGIGRALHGRRFGAPRRHGKWLIAPAGDGRHVLFHFGMTGGLHWRGAGRRHEARDRFVRLVIAMRGGELRYHAQRKLGGVWLARGETGIAEVTGPLGPDAARLDAEGLAQRLADRRGGLKAALMDQSLLAGLGNELSDEILWRAALDPRSRVPELEAADVRRLHRAMRRVLTASLRHGRIPQRRGWLRNARDEDDPHCPRCGRRLAHARVAGRTSWWCPHDQARR